MTEPVCHQEAATSTVHDFPACAGGGKGGGNDGGRKTLRVSPPPWKALRDSPIPPAPTPRLFFKFNPCKELSSATCSGYLQAHSSIRKDWFCDYVSCDGTREASWVIPGDGG